jgi:hypothetical protein
MTESKLEDRLNRILVDIVSVTDEVRREQLQDEYFEVEAQLLEEKETTSLDNYRRSYKTTSLTEALEVTNGIDVSGMCNKYKLRPLTSLENTRSLVAFLSAVDATLVIRDIEGVVVDTIGRGSREYSITIFCISKTKLDMMPCVRIVQ